MGELTAYYVTFSAFVVGAGLWMLSIYTLSFPWWKDSVGRILVAYVSADILMAILLCLAVAFHIDPVWFRVAWFALQIVVGTTFCIQGAYIVRLRRRRAQRKEREPA